MQADVGRQGVRRGAGGGGGGGVGRGGRGGLGGRCGHRAFSLLIRGVIGDHGRSCRRTSCRLSSSRRW
ncbi:hypothetical protein FMM49_13335 [Streptomyces rimosus subsp. rimosus]|nr:hypothetical protein CTZ40_12820 [Streptomyces rimosus]QEV75781.1 hypothetical protein CP984_12790 [Streptomyces rimosus]QTL86595.1 hypothetical protein FMM49_13335 [Streptomyces rimosus subsp. rimosus]